MCCPPVCLANSQLNNAVRAPPTWRYPVGEGAKRTRGGVIVRDQRGEVRGMLGRRGPPHFLPLTSHLNTEREGFEPSIGVDPLCRFSKPVPSATRPPLQRAGNSRAHLA